MKDFKGLLKLLKRDFNMGRNSIIIRYIFFIIFFLVITLLNIRSMRRMEEANSSLVLWDMFKGCSFVDITNGSVNRDFQFPIMWLLINCFIIYALGDYFYNDLKVNGKYLVIRVKNIRLIYISKFIWSVIMIFLFYGLLIFLTMALGFLFRNVGEEVVQEPLIQLAGRIFILYFFTSVTLTAIFITLTLRFKPVYGFIADTAILVLSVFSRNRFFIGQQNLLMRHVPYTVEGNLSVVFSIIYCIDLTMVIITVGSVLSKRKEIF